MYFKFNKKSLLKLKLGILLPLSGVTMPMHLVAKGQWETFCDSRRQRTPMEFVVCVATAMMESGPEAQNCLQEIFVPSSDGSGVSLNPRYTIFGNTYFLCLLLQRFYMSFIESSNPNISKQAEMSTFRGNVESIIYADTPEVGKRLNMFDDYITNRLICRIDTEASPRIFKNVSSLGKKTIAIPQTSSLHPVLFFAAHLLVTNLDIAQQILSLGSEVEQINSIKGIDSDDDDDDDDDEFYDSEKEKKKTISSLLLATINKMNEKASEVLANLENEEDKKYSDYYDKCLHFMETKLNEVHVTQNVLSWGTMVQLPKAGNDNFTEKVLNSFGDSKRTVTEVLFNDSESKVKKDQKKRVIRVHSHRKQAFTLKPKHKLYKKTTPKNKKKVIDNNNNDNDNANNDD